MKQALHIFLKDVRRLRIQIALLMVAIGYFTWLDIRLPKGFQGTGGLVIESIVGAIVWFLIARAVHEESLPGENQFWLTRPYRRASLLGAKLLMVALVVFVPFFLADCVILGAQSLPVAGNLGGLILRQFVTAAWLVLPPFAIASVTRSITEDVMVWIVGLGIAGLCYFPLLSGVTFQASNEKYWFGAAILLMIAVLWRQYLRRGVIVSRALMAAAVLLPVLPFPNSAAVGIEQMWNDPATAGISLTAKSSGRVDGFDTECINVRVGVNGVRPGWRVIVLAERDTFTGDGKSVSIPWIQGGSTWNMDMLPVCASAKTRSTVLGANRKFAIRASVILGVFASGTPIDIKATEDPFMVPGVGRCQFRTFGIYYGQNYQLVCEAPVRMPMQGSVTIAGEAGTGISMVAYPVTPLGLLPGMSPVYNWVTLPRDVQIRRALANGESIEFTPEKRIAVIEREIDLKDVEF